MKLLVQGWRFIHHSYALVAQAHSVCLLRRGDVELRFQDLPFLKPEWQPSRGILDVVDTPEYRALRPGVMRKLRAGAAAADRVHMLVPSRWAAEGYLRFGIAPERVHVVPHGVDLRVLHPAPERRTEARRRFGFDEAF